MREVKATLISDVVCPWCYLGVSRVRWLTAEAEQEGSARIELRFLPWMVNPSTSRKVQSRNAAYVKRFGAAEAARMQRAWVKIYGEEGLEFRAEDSETGSSFDAHRLARWAREQGGPDREAAFYWEVFQSHFGRGKAPSDREVLVAAARKVGLDGAQAAAVLQSEDALAAGVRAEMKVAGELLQQLTFSTGVPLLLLEDTRTKRKQVVPGAQDREVFRAVLARLIRKAKADEAKL
eukprot:Hpha_TRINITY_DN15335_c1_g5::TRINITY_DN15335_c1_g5_i1::g.91854::m.91854